MSTKKCIYPDCKCASTGVIETSFGKFYHCDEHKDAMEFDMMLLPRDTHPIDTRRWISKKERNNLLKKYGIRIIAVNKLEVGDCFVVKGSCVDAPFDHFRVAVVVSKKDTIGFKPINFDFNKINTVVSDISYVREFTKSFFMNGYVEMVGTRNTLTFDTWESKTVKSKI